MIPITQSVPMQRCRQGCTEPRSYASDLSSDSPIRHSQVLQRQTLPVIGALWYRMANHEENAGILQCNALC